MKSDHNNRRNVTVQDVARVAGVSAMTVSRVVNDSHRVRESTRTAVLDVIERLQYRPNTAARSLVKGEGTQIGLLYANPSSAYLSQLLLGALAGALRYSCHLLLEPCNDEGVLAQVNAARRFARARVQAVILPPPFSDALAAQEELDREGIPWVTIAMGRPSPSSLNVRIDDYHAALEMTRYLIALGHRNIAFIRGQPSQMASIERYRGFVTGIGEAGLDPGRMPIEHGDFSFRSGLECAERILGRSPRPTAIFASNDDMAAASVGVAHRQLLRVPEDVSVVGFDDSALATTIWPELTTIRQPIADMAESAVALLSSLLQRGTRGASVAHRELVFPHHLIVRGSTAPPLAPIANLA
jgi:LacI family transcriptional regulator